MFKQQLQEKNLFTIYCHHVSGCCLSFSKYAFFFATLSGDCFNFPAIWHCLFSIYHLGLINCTFLLLFKKTPSFTDVYRSSRRQPIQFKVVPKCFLIIIICFYGNISVLQTGSWQNLNAPFFGGRDCRWRSSKDEHFGYIHIIYLPVIWLQPWVK